MRLISKRFNRILTTSRSIMNFFTGSVKKYPELVSDSRSIPHTPLPPHWLHFFNSGAHERSTPLQNVGGLSCYLYILDPLVTAQFKGLRDARVMEADCFVFMYSAVNAKSLPYLVNDIEAVLSLKNKSLHQIPAVLVCNKIDLTTEEKSISTEDSIRFAKYFNLSLIETSIKAAVNVGFVYDEVVREYLRKNSSKKVKDNPKLKIVLLGGEGVGKTLLAGSFWGRHRGTDWPEGFFPRDYETDDDWLYALDNKKKSLTAKLSSFFTSDSFTLHYQKITKKWKAGDKAPSIDWKTIFTLGEEEGGKMQFEFSHKFSQALCLPFKGTTAEGQNAHLIPTIMVVVLFEISMTSLKKDNQTLAAYKPMMNKVYKYMKELDQKEAEGNMKNTLELLQTQTRLIEASEDSTQQKTAN